MSLDHIIEKFDREVGKMGVRIKDANQMKVMENVFDEVTLIALYKMVHKKRISAIGGSISTGKEANVFYVEREDEAIAIKIYRIQSANFKTMSIYLAGDPRFSSVRNSKKDIIFAWTKKEYANLMRAHEVGLRVPEPYFFDRNILLMEFMGENEVPYPQLRQAKIEDYAPVYEEILASMKTLYQKADLVHADLSEFNILWDGKSPIIIDMGQAVTSRHPQAQNFLIRDIKNINRFFGKHCDIRHEISILIDITGKREEI